MTTQVLGEVLREATTMPVTTALDFPSWKVERSIGPCFGLIVRSMGTVKSMGAGFKGMRQGEVPQYTEIVAYGTAVVVGSK